MKRILAAASIVALTTAAPVAAQEDGGVLTGTLFTIGETAVPTMAVIGTGFVLGGVLLIASDDDDGASTTSSTGTTPAPL
ncbi:hypothetical protein ACQ5SO_15355 [Rhodovulum sp. DZ06]|uniref:hypothetical protein n=1 Tax=Rhodovulum sp. DZ06 TaxID=3425126 RepID=UPI003D33850C